MWASVPSLQWRHNERNGASNSLRHECLHNCLFRRRSKKISKLHVTGFCEGNSPVTGEFPAQMDINAENVSIWWRHHSLIVDGKKGESACHSFQRQYDIWLLRLYQQQAIFTTLVVGYRHQGFVSIWRDHLTSIRNPIVVIWWSYDRLISTMGFPLLVRWHFL